MSRKIQGAEYKYNRYHFDYGYALEWAPQQMLPRGLGPLELYRLTQLGIERDDNERLRQMVIALGGDPDAAFDTRKEEEECKNQEDDSVDSSSFLSPYVKNKFDIPPDPEPERQDVDLDTGEIHSLDNPPAEFDLAYVKFALRQFPQVGRCLEARRCCGLFRLPRQLAEVPSPYFPFRLIV